MCLRAAEGDDGDYHSPKSVSESVASGYFSATESNASGLPVRSCLSHCFGDRLLRFLTVLEVAIPLHWWQIVVCTDEKLMTLVWWKKQQLLYS